MIIKAVQYVEKSESGNVSRVACSTTYFEVLKIFELQTGRISEEMEPVKTFKPFNHIDGEISIFPDYFFDPVPGELAVRILYQELNENVKDVCFGSSYSVYIMENGKTIDRYGF